MTRIALAVTLLFLGRLPASAQPPPNEVPREGAYRVSVDVNLVVLNATVRDPSGAFVPDLDEADFEVYENGVRQSVRLFQHEDVPVTVGLVIDHSRSMQHKLTEVITAARTFVQYSRPDDQMFVVNFNENVTFGLPGAMPFTHRAEELGRAIFNTPAAGMTALYDAVIEAHGRLQAGTPAKKVLIVISDGGDTASTHRLADVLKTAEESAALVYTIGIFDEDDPDRNPNVLRRLAHSTGGEAFFPTRLDEVVEICERIAHEIRNQYTLGYVSSNRPEAGGYRSIRVTARAPGKGKLSVRTRAGYVPQGAK